MFVVFEDRRMVVDPDVILRETNDVARHKKSVMKFWDTVTAVDHWRWLMNDGRNFTIFSRN